MEIGSRLRGNKLKGRDLIDRDRFIQHPDLKTKLLETGKRPIGEASARDKYWGIGTSADTTKANDPSKWPGKNVLGKMLMELRTELTQ